MLSSSPQFETKIHAPALTGLKQRKDIYPATRSNITPARLACGIQELDHFFDGGLILGNMIEWGALHGQGGREILVHWLAKATQKQWVLWIHAAANALTIYPPAWAARGISLEKIRFAKTTAPLRDLHPIFMETFFRIIVIDSPTSFSKEDCAFLARRARINKQIIFLVRDSALNSTRGNIWAKLRINTWYEPRYHQYHLDIIRGLPPRHLALNKDILS